MEIVIIIGIVAAVGYYMSLRLHPLTKCKMCHGGRHYGSVYTYAYQRCHKCGGSGRADRLGTRLFLGGTKGTGHFTKH